MQTKSKFNILIVEDDHIISKYLAIDLEDLGYSILGICHSGDELFKELKKKEKPDLILMDIRVKGDDDGIKLTGIINKKYNIPVIYITAYSDDSTLSRAKDTKSYGYIIKPYSEQILKVTLEMAQERIKADNLINHYNRVLTSVKNVNQLLHEEGDPGKLIKKICQKLINLKCYKSAWIILFDKNNQNKNYGYSGPSIDNKKLSDFFQKNINPPCKKNLLDDKKGDYLIIQDNKLCITCLHNNIKEKHIIIKITYKDVIFGMMHVSLPFNIDTSEQEIDLLKELSSDIAYALYSIELDKSKKIISKEKQQLMQRLIESEKESAISHLSAGIAHEFNNILSVLKSSAELLILEYNQRNLKLSKNIIDELDLIVRQSEKGKEIVDNLFSFARPKQTKFEKCNLFEIIDQTATLDRYDLVKSGTKIEYDFPSNDINVYVNRTQMQQVFLNLFINAQHAIKLKEEENGIIKISLKKIKNDFTLSFKDNGIGIEKKVLDKIFIPFFTTKTNKAAYTKQIRGTGLGLSVVQNIIKNHNWEISVSSVVNQGTEFKLIIPEIIN